MTPDSLLYCEDCKHHTNHVFVVNVGVCQTCIKENKKPGLPIKERIKYHINKLLFSIWIYIFNQLECKIRKSATKERLKGTLKWFRGLFSSNKGKSNQLKPTRKGTRPIAKHRFRQILSRNRPSRFS